MVLVGLFGWAIIFALKSEPFNQSAIKSTKTAQQADAPFGYAVDGKVPEYDEKLQVLSAFDRVKTPVAHYFTNELGKAVKQNVVHCVADGYVVYAGIPNEKWGETLVVAHKLTDGRFFLSYYAGLDSLRPRINTLIGRGQKLGSVNGNLLFELHHADGCDFSNSSLTKVDLAAFAKGYNPEYKDGVPESTLKIMLEQEHEKRFQALQTEQIEQSLKK